MNQTAINYGQVLLELAVPREDIESSRQMGVFSPPAAGVDQPCHSK